MPNRNDIENGAINAIMKKIGSQLDQVSIILDTETTGDRNHAALPVQVGMTRMDTGETKTGYVWYGDDATTRKYLLEAMNLTDEKTGELVESARQLRRANGLKSVKGIINSFETLNEKASKAFEAAYKANYGVNGSKALTPNKISSQIVKWEKEMGMLGAKVAGHNIQYDMKAMDALVDAVDKRYSSKAARLKEITSHEENTVDTFDIVAKITGGAFYNDNKTYDSKTLGSAGVLSQENIAKLLGVTYSGGAHDAGSDTATLFEIINKIRDDGAKILYKTAQKILKEAKEEKIPIFNKKGDFSARYKNFAKKKTAEISQIVAKRNIQDAVEYEKALDIVFKNDAAQVTQEIQKASNSMKSSPKSRSNAKAMAASTSGNFAFSIYKALEQQGKGNELAVSGARSAAANLRRNGIKEGNINNISSYGSGTVSATPNATGGYFAAGSMGELFSELHKTVQEKGGDLTYEIDGNTVRFWVVPEGGLDKNGNVRNQAEAVNFDVVLVDEQGNLNSGEMSIRNIMTAGYSNGNITMSTVQERQVQNVINTLNRINDVTELQDSPKRLARSSRRAIEDITSSPISSVEKEIKGMLVGNKGAMQSTVAQGMVDWTHIAAQLNYLAGQEEGEAYYYKPDGDLPYASELQNSQYLRDFMLVVNSVLSGTEELLERYEGDNETVKRILGNESFIGALRNLRSQGFTSRLEGIKPQATAKGFTTLGGGAAANALTAFHNPSDRAPTQVLNTLKRRNTNYDDANRNMFVRLEGLLQGIDYNDARYEQVTGARINKDQFNTAFKDILSQSGMDLEDAVILSESTAKELESYQAQTYKFGELTNLPDFIIEGPMEITEGLKEKFNEFFKSIGEDYEVEVGDIVRGFKTVNGVTEVMVEKLKKVSTGTKLLLENGNRVTARVISDAAYEKGIDALGNEYKNAKYLIEDKKLTAKTMGPAFGGRLREIAKRAGFDAFAGAVQNNDAYEILNRMFDFDYENKIIIDKSDYSAELGAFIGKDGKRLFGNGTREEQEREFEKLWASIDAIGQALLGGDYNPMLLAGAIGVADVYDYQNATGMGDEETLSYEGRVHYDKKARSANERKLNAIKDSIVGIEYKPDSKITETDMANYMAIESQRINASSQKREEAQHTIDSINDAIDKTFGRKASSGGNQIEILTQGANFRTDENGNRYITDAIGREQMLADNQIFIDEINTAYEYSDFLEGTLKENQALYETTLEGMVQTIKTKKGWQDSDVEVVIKDANIVYGRGESFGFYRDGEWLGAKPNTKDVYLPDFGSPAKSYGRFIPSGLGNNARGLISSFQTGDTESQRASFEKHLKEFNDAANDKHSSYARTAQFSNIGSSSFTNVVGLGHTDDGAITIGEDYLRTFLRSSQGSDFNEWKDATNQLLNVYRAQVEMTEAEASEFTKVIDNENATLDDIQNIQEKIIGLIINAMQGGKLNLSGSLARYPLISGKDMHAVDIKIDKSLNGSETLGIPAQLASAVKMDFDGDKSRLEIISTSRRSESLEMERKATAIDKERVAIDKKINELAFNFKQKTKEATQEESVPLSKEVIASAESQFAAVMSKYNFGYVGQLSNANTNLRDTLTNAGWDTKKATSASAGYADIVNAFFQSLEQDAISAKKVFERLSLGDSDYSVDELDKMYQSYRNGDLVGALEIAEKIGLIKEWAGNEQFLHAAARIKVTNKDFFDENIDYFNQETGQMDISLIQKALSAVQDLFGGLVTKDGVRQLKGQDEWKKVLYANSDAGVNLGKPIDAIAETINQDYKVLTHIRKSKNYGTNHQRIVRDLAGDIKIALGDNSVSSVSHGVRGNFQPFYNNMGGGESVASVGGSYAHKMMELMAKSGGALHTVEEILTRHGIGGEEEDKELISLRDKLKEGSRKQYERGAQAMMNYANSAGLFTNSKVYMSEQEFAGQYGEGDVIAGGSDLFTFTEDENGMLQAIVHDYKFSNDGSEKTLEERMFQGSQYAMMGFEQLQKELEMTAEQRKEVFGDDGLIYTYFKDDEELAKKGAIALKNARVQIHRYMFNSDAIETVTAKALDFGKVKLGQQAILKQAVLPEDFMSDVMSGASTSYTSNKDTDTFNYYKTLLEQERTLHTKMATAGGKMGVLAAQGKENTVEYNKQARAVEFLTGELDKLNKVLDELENSGKLDLLSDSQRENLESYRKTTASQTEEIVRANTEDANTIYTKRAQEEYSKLVTQRLRKESQLSKYQLDASRAEHLLSNAPRKQQDDYRAYSAAAQNNMIRAQGELEEIQKRMVELEKSGVALEADKTRLAQGLAKIEGDKIQKIQQQNAYYNNQRGILQMMFGTLQQSVSRFFDYSAIYMLINEVKQIFRQVIQYTAQLDSKMVDLQIATGSLRTEVKGMLKDYNALAKEVGRTTSAVADAANDWLRAGYEGKEATDLVRASMYLSTLGMMEASEATSDLISVLKGWKLESEDIIGVVDKLVKVDMSAAVSAGDIAEAMQMVNYSAQQAGLEMNTLIGILTTNQEVTQRSAQVVGNSWKTVLARIQNVKAGKYTASYEDMQEEGYAEEDWAALNDVETVLGTVGIQLRETATQWRSTEEILNEVARKWENFDEVTQSAIANAFAGTRQRENFIATISNWDSVQRFAEISANAYGTATTKMEAFTSSVEASKNRVTAAVEAWALYFDGAEFMKGFYNLIADVVNNLPLIAAIGAVVLVLGNFNTVTTNVIGTLTTLSAKLVNFGHATDTFFANVGNVMTTGRLSIDENKSIINAAEAGYLVNYFKKDTIARAGAGGWGAQHLIDNFAGAQRMAFSFNRATQNSLGATIGLITGKNAFGANGLNIDNILDADIDNNIWNVIGALDNFDEETQGLIATLADGGITAENSADALALLARANADYGDQLSLLNDQMAQSQKRRGGMAQGAFALLGSGAGILGGSFLGDAIGGDKGKILGATIGPIIGNATFSGIFKNRDKIGKLFASIVGKGSVLESVKNLGLAGGLQFAGAIGIALTAAFAVVKMIKDAEREAAREAFKEAENVYNNRKTMGAQAAQYDELAKGVDNFGRNISLSDEDYQKFLNISNDLADTFPELISYTDEAGNRFVGLAGNIGGVTEEIERLIKEAQKVTDEKLLNPVLFGEAKKQAQQDKANYNETLGAYRGLLNGSFNAYMGASNYGNYSEAKATVDDLRHMGYAVSLQRSTDMSGDYMFTVDPKDKKAVETILQSKIDELENSIRRVNGDYLDQYNSMIRRDPFMNAQTESMKVSDPDAYNLLQKVLGSGAVDVNSDTLDTDLKQIIGQIAAFSDNPIISEAFNTNESNVITPYDYQAIIERGLEELRIAYEKEGVNKEAFANAVNASGKYYVDENGIIQQNTTRYTQAYNTIGNTLAFGHGLSTADQTNITGLMQILDADQLNTLTELVTEGIIGRTGTGLNRTNDEIMSLIMSEGPYAKTVQGYSSFYLNKRESYENMTDSETGVRATNFISDSYEEELDKIRNLSDKEVGEIFGEFGVSAVKAFKLARTDLEEQMGEGLEDTEDGVKDFWKLFYQEAEKGVNSAYDEFTKFTLADVFSDVDLGEDGLISNFKELKDVMDSVANSFATLEAAQEEYNSTGTLSVETVLDMLSADEDYLSVLEVENGNIQLVDNATEVLAGTKLSAAKAGLVQMYQSRLTEAAELQQAITSGQLADANDTEIESAKALVSANTTLAASSLMDAKAAYASAIGHQMAAVAKAAEAAGVDPTGSLAGLADQLKEAQAAAHVVETVGAGLADSIQSAPKKNGDTTAQMVQRLEQITGISGTEMFKVDKDTGSLVLNEKYDLSKYDASADIVNGNYVGPWTNGELAVTGALINSNMFDDAGNFKGRYNKPTSGGKTGGSKNEPKEKTMEELMDAAEGIIDKEWEAMKALDRLDNGEARAYTEYFVLKREALENKLKGYEDSMKRYQEQFLKGEITESELEYHRLEYQKKEIETKKAIRNLDDEEVEDAIKILGNLKASKETIVEQYKQLLNTADTEEERIEYTKKLNDALEDQVDTVKTIYEFQKSIYEFQLKYESLTPDSKGYGVYMQYSLDNLMKRADQAKTEAEKAFERAKEEAIEARRQMIDSNGNRLYSEEQIQAWAKSGEAEKAALEDSSYRGWITEYMDLYTQIGDIFMEDFNNKVNVIQKQIDKLNDEKPQEWASVWNRGHLTDTAFARIDEYYQASDKMQNQIISEVQAVLEHASQLTDEQIQEAVDKWNDAIKQIHENAIARLNDIKDYQESTYSALVNEVNRYIKQIEKQKEIVEDAYDKELEKLQDKEDAIERTNKLLELQNNLQNAQNERQRVYREGIGWVYEQDRQKIREAEKDLDDFYRQDAIDDLNNAKDAELAILDDRIKNWQDYLEMLEEKYNEFNVLQEQRLLMELLGVESEEEVYELIKNDMLAFNEYVDTHTQAFIDNQHAAFLNFDTIFNEFMANYKSNLEELRKLVTENMQLIESAQYLNMNNIVEGEGMEIAEQFETGIAPVLAPTFDKSKWHETTVTRDGKEIKAYLIDGYTYDEQGVRFNFKEGDVSHTGGGDYRWEKGEDGTYKGVYVEGTKGNNSYSSNKKNDSSKTSVAPGLKETTVTQADGTVVKAYLKDGHTVNADGSAYSFKTGDVVKTAGGDWKIKEDGTAEKVPSYAYGIDNGPVTYTGLAMLHGSSSNPEYVLNSDQAYSLLRYMATTKPDFVNNNSETGTQYVLNGDIVLNEVEDASEFWNEVTMAMDRRISVTKNNR